MRMTSSPNAADEGDPGHYPELRALLPYILLLIYV